MGAGTLVFGGGITGGAAGATVLTLSGSNTNTNNITGVIANGSATSLGITKQDAGTWQLSGANTYTGATIVSGGTLKLNNSSALGNATVHTSGVTVSNGAALDLNGSSQATAGAITLNLNGTQSATVGALTSSIGTAVWAGTVTLQTASSIGGAGTIILNGPVAGAVGLTKVGAGALILSGATNGTTTTTVSGGTLQIGTGGTTGALGSGLVTVATGATLTFNRSDTLTQGTDFAGGITGGGALTQNGGGTGVLILNQANSYTGRTTVNGGTLLLDVGAGPILSASSALTLGGGTLRLTGTGTQNLNTLTTTSNTGSRILLDASQNLTLGALTSTGASSSLNFNTAAGGASGATVGNGVIVLTGQTAGNAVNSGFTVTDSTGFGLATVNGANQVVRKTDTLLLPATGAISTVDYRVIGGSGVSASSSAKSITMDTTFGGTSLFLDPGVVLSNNTWNFGGSDGSSGIVQIFGSAAGAGLRSATLNGQIDINNYNNAPVYIDSPILANGTNALNVKGTGTTVLSGSNTYTGGTNIRGGELSVEFGGSITHSAAAMTVGSASGDNGTLILAGGTVSSSTGTLGSALGSLGTAEIFDGTWTNSGNLTVGNSGTGVLNISGTGAVSNFRTDIGLAHFASGTANVSGGGTWTLSGSLFVGGFGTGVLNISGTGAVSNVNQGGIGTSVSSSGTVTVSGGTWTNNSTLTVGLSGTGVLNITDSGQVYAGGVAGTGTVTVGSSPGSSGTLNLGTGGTAGTLNAATVTGGSGTAVVNFNQTGSYSFAPRLTGGLAVNKLGAGTTTLTNATNSYTKATTISDGILSVATIGNGGVGGNLGAATNAAANLVFDGGTLQYTGATAGTDRNFTINAGKTATFDIASAATNLTVSGASTATTGALTKTGAGTLTLTGSNLHSGNTTIKAGTLKLDAAGNLINTANLIVGDALSTGAILDVTTKTGGLTIGGVVAQTLSGIGQVNGNTTIASLGTHAPGNSPGLQTFNGNLAYSTGSMVNWELISQVSTDTSGVRGVFFDAVDVLSPGALSIASGVTSKLFFNGTGSAVNWNDTFWDSSHNWLVYDNALAPTLSSGLIFDTINVSQDFLGATLTDGSFAWSQVGNDVYLNFTPVPVPEPATYGVLLALGLIGIGAVDTLRRRRRAQA